jgi:multidrug resistance efflux pump
LVGVATSNATVGELLGDHSGRFFGQVKPRQTIRIAAEVGGKAELVPHDRGAWVSDGEILVTLEQAAFELAVRQASKAVDSAVIRVAQVEKSLALERAKLDAGLKQAEAAVDAAAARLRLVEAGARSEEKAQVKASVKGAKAAMENAVAELGRIRRLAQAEVATGQQLEAAETAAKVATAAYDKAYQAMRQVNSGARDEDKDVARAGLKQAEAIMEEAMAMALAIEVRAQELEGAKAAVEMARLQLESAELAKRKSVVRVVLPGGGKALVLARNIDPGEFVAPGAPLFELLLTDRPRLVVLVPAPMLSAFPQGRKVEVTCHGLEGQTIAGVVVLTPQQADPMTSNFPVEIELDNANGALRMGQVCEVVAPKV